MEFLPRASALRTTAVALSAVPFNWSNTATLRRADENSSAKIFISDTPLLLAQLLKANPPMQAGQFLHCAFFLLHSLKPFLRPLNHSHSFRLVKVILQTCANNLFARFQPIQVQ